MKYLGTLTLFVVLSVALNPSSGQGADSCFSTLSNDMKIHVPSVQFAGAFYDVNFEVLTQGPSAETGVWLRLQTITAANLLNCSNPAVFFQSGPSYTLRIPVLTYGSFAFWVDLEWIPTSDSYLWLMLAALGEIISPAYASPVPDTGQTKCYDDSKEIPCPSPGQPFYGQDAHYTLNSPSYTKLDGNGNALPDSAALWSMVRDNVTGLIWESKTSNNRVQNYSDPHDADNNYTWYDPDSATNGGNAGTEGDNTDAKDFIDGLNSAKFGGFEDWRLPTIKELSFLIDYSIPEPGPTIDTAYFPNTVDANYWSSTTNAENPGSAWDIDFGEALFGNFNYYPKSIRGYLRAVRGGQSGSNFVDNGDGTISDTTTGLMWQKYTHPGTWEEALAYCEGLTLGDHSDWRVPTIKELDSIVDYGGSPNPINPTFFPNTVGDVYWASGTCADDPGSAWGINFYTGHGTNRSKSNSLFVRAVRGE